MLILISKFHTSGPTLRRPEHTLYKNVDWAQVDAGLYAVVDPMDNHAILYFSEREYKVQVRVSLSQDRTLIVLARPGDTPVLTSDTSSPVSSKQNSPTSGISKAESKFWKRFLNFHLGNLGSLSSSKKRNKSDEDASVSLSRAMLETLIPYWGLDLHFRLGGSLEPPIQLVRDLRVISKKLCRILECNGPNYLIQKLKNTLFILNKYLAGSRADNPFLLGTPVGLNRVGIPSIFPVHLRKQVREGNMLTIKMLTSLINSFRAFEGTWDQVDLQTITGAHPTLDSQVEGEFRDFCKEVFWPKVIKGHLPTKVWKECCDLENSLKIKETDRVYVPLNAGPNGPTGLLCAPQDAHGWINLANQGEINHLKRWCEHVGDSRTLELWSQCLSLYTDTHLSEVDMRASSDYGSPTDLGRLGIIPEPAGKVRVVAIVDYWTQRVMKPVHDWMMLILKHLPTDGTFDQEGALESFNRWLIHNDLPVYSIDLKAATDLIPIALYRAVLEGLWPAPTVDLWINLLTDRKFRVPQDKLVKKGLRGTTVKYGRGQPMGTLSSWPSMALVHHALTLFAASRSGKDPSLFTGYRVLGDDNVTAGTDVAENYVAVAKALCVPTSAAKTLDGKLFIFAQQIYLKGGGANTAYTNISPLSLKEELGIKSFGQRLEMALRAIRRGWLATRRNVYSLLRLLLTRADYVRSRRQWTSGILDKVAQAALISAFGLGGHSLMENHLGLKSSIKPFLLSMLNRVEALAGDQSKPVLEYGDSKVHLSDDLLQDLERNIASAVAGKLLKKVNSILADARISSIRFRMWEEAVEETGFLPLAIETRKGPNEPGIAIAPFTRDGGIDSIKTLLEKGLVPGYPSPYKDYRTKELRDFPVKLPHPVRGVEPFYSDYGADWISGYDRALWCVIRDTYGLIFGTSTEDEPSYDDYVEEEDGGMGMSFTSEETSSASPSGWSVTTPLLETALIKARAELTEIMDDLVRGDQEAAWVVLEKYAETVAAVERLPDFKSLGSFKATLRPVDEFNSFRAKVNILTKAIEASGSLIVDLTTPRGIVDLSKIRPGVDEALRELDSLVGVVSNNQTNRGLSTG